MNNTKRRVSCPQLTKLTFIFTLLLGWGSQAWGDETIFDGNSDTDIEGWTPSNISYNTYNKVFQTYGTGTITSNSTVYFPTGSQLVINARGMSTFATRAITVEYSNDNGSSWQTAGTFNSSSSPAIDTGSGSFKDFSISLSGTYKIKITGVTIAIKSITKVEPSGPAAPSSFEVSSIAFDRATLGWTAGGTENQWQVYYSDEEGIPAEKDVPAAINVNTLDLTDLTENTKYYCYVRAYINAETHSEWTSISFTTAEQYPTPTSFTLSSYSATTATFEWSNGLGTTPTNWQLKYSMNEEFDPDTEGESKTLTDNPYTLESLTENATYYAYLRAYFSSGETYSNWTSKQMFTPTTADLVLDENNTTAISKISSKKVLLKYQPTNGWNTICVPFYVYSYMNTIFGTGWKAYALTSYSSNTITFERANYPGSSTPYLVYIESAPNNSNGVLLTGVSINSDNPSPGSSKNNGATFQGTYTRKDYITDDNWYGITSEGKVLKAGTGAYVKGYRAYFTGVSAPAGARLTIAIDDDGETTDLGFVKMVDPEAKDVYTLSGQKVQKAGKGIYIVNGRKVVIK